MDNKRVERIKLGLVFFSTNHGWAGGVNYIVNIVNALNTLPDYKKPFVNVYYSPDSPIEEIKIIRYPYIKLFLVKKEPSIILKGFNYLSISLIKKSFIISEKTDFLYPYCKWLTAARKNIYWIPDFQDYYLPEHFSQKELRRRKKFHHSIAQSKKIVVFSSIDAKRDFEKFYPRHSCSIFLLPFATTIPHQSELDKVNVIDKYNIRNKYFLCCNQFWKHKNHKIILEALRLIKDEQITFKVVFTGAQIDSRDSVPSKHFEELRAFVRKNELDNYVQFLGFINRIDQLKLIKDSIAVIQPSLFEGWSTVIEDAKALNKYVVASNLNVHKEQLIDNYSFFDPYSQYQLADILVSLSKSPPINKISLTKKHVETFALRINEMLELNR
jgi:glycosyltransferase involved in cell wall biosynthesis